MCKHRSPNGHKGAAPTKTNPISNDWFGVFLNDKRFFFAVSSVFPSSSLFVLGGGTKALAFYFNDLELN